jgi:hypothetical protein
MSPTRISSPSKARHGTIRSAESNSAVPKCITVGVLKVEMPSLLVARSRSFTSVMTTNIRPVSAAADEPTTA